MQPNTFSVHFIVRSNRMNKKGHVPIYAKVTINGQIVLFSLNHKIKSEDWLSKDGLAKGNSNLNKEINQHLESFKSRIYQTYSKLLATDLPLNAENFKKSFYGKTVTEKDRKLIEITIQHNQHFEKMLGIKYSPGSYKNYKTTLKYLIEFVPKYYKKKDIPLKEVDYKFCESYFEFLTTVKTCNQNGANKHIQRLKKIINYSIKQGYILHNTLAMYSLEFDPVNKTALTLPELTKLKELELHREVLVKVRDAFLFQCYTGLSYADIKVLNKAHIDLNSEKGSWVRMEREKTKIGFSVPLIEPALEIIEKYWHYKHRGLGLLPVLSNQKMNHNLKIIQELAGISKNLTSHLARHTFATTITLGHGVPIETVSKMLGHTKLATTQVYAKVLESKIEQDMKIVKKNLKL